VQQIDYVTDGAQVTPLVERAREPLEGIDAEDVRSEQFGTGTKQMSGYTENSRYG
jgi:hypothetical protein